MTFWDGMRKAAEPALSAPDWKCAGINLSENYETYRERGAMTDKNLERAREWMAKTGHSRTDSCFRILQERNTIRATLDVVLEELEKLLRSAGTFDADRWNRVRASCGLAAAKGGG